jgi:hypothetical protein
VDDKGASIGWNISKRIFRAMIDSALGLDPEDMSDAAKAKRQLRGLADLNGITFVGKIAVEPNKDARYPDQNRLDHPVLPNEKEWRAGDQRRKRPAAPLEAAIDRRWPRRDDRSGASVGRRTTKAGGGTTGDRCAALAPSGRNRRTGSAANGGTSGTAGEAGGPCLAERLTPAGSTELCECR